MLNLLRVFSFNILKHIYLDQWNLAGLDIIMSFAVNYFLVWSGGSSTTKDSGVTPEISFVLNGILNEENQLSKMEF